MPSSGDGERDLPRLLRDLDPRLGPDEVVFVVTPSVSDDVRPLAWVREDEGTTFVLPRADADRLGLPYTFVAAAITLRVHSALDAVGLTAAVASALSEAGISANVIAGYHHDHLFVPAHDARRALEVLRALSS